MTPLGDRDFLEPMLPLKRVAQTVGLWGQGSILGQGALLERLGCPQDLSQWLVPSRTAKAWIGCWVTLLGQVTILTAPRTQFHSFSGISSGMVLGPGLRVLTVQWVPSQIGQTGLQFRVKGTLGIYRRDTH